MTHKRHTLYRMAGSVLFVLCVLSQIGEAERPLDGRTVLLFDLGPAGSTPENQAIELNLDSSYKPTVGYGWTHRPHNGFHRPELSRSRSALTIDGVAGERLGLRADVDPGTWYVTIWLEMGRTDDHWPQVNVQGQQQMLRWQRFRPHAEPSRSLQKVYRVLHCATTVGAEGLFLEITEAQEHSRLLGVSLIRQVSGSKPEHQAFLQQIAAECNYRNRTSPCNLLSQAEASLRKNPTDAFYAIWQQRLALLTMAEQYYAMRGWQSADDETGLGMFDRLHQAVMLLDGLLMADFPEARALADRASYFRGRLLYWLGKERGGVHEIAGGERNLELLAEKYPDDELLAMYTGQRIDQADPCDDLEPTDDAPGWSIAQREALCRLRHLAYWWVEQRQLDNGEFGGKLGDDVELLRWWAPLCLAGDETAIRGWKRLADGVWQSKHVFEGYARNVADVEHAAEFVADTAPLMLLYSDDPGCVQRLAYSAEHFESLWTGMTTDGNRHFRSAWFSSTDLESGGPKGRDLEYNTRAVQAMRYLAWRQRDPKLVDLLHQWSTAWVRAAMRTDKGKPQGIIPASVRFPDEAINGEGPNWYQAGMYWDYYEWEHFAGSLMLDQLLFTYTLTKDERLLQPMFKALELIRLEEASLGDGHPAELPAGSPAWAAAKLVRCGLFWNVVEQWRFMTGDPHWDDLIMEHGTAYGRYRISGNERHLVDGLNQFLEGVRYNTPLKTSEALFTDRVYVPGAEFVKAMLTGDGIYDNLSPYYSVSWQQTDDDFTALVTDANSDRLEVHLFSHGGQSRRVVMRVWQLAPGDYDMLCKPRGLEPDRTTVAVAEAGQRIPITLPSQRLVRVTLLRNPK